MNGYTAAGWVNGFLVADLVVEVLGEAGHESLCEDQGGDRYRVWVAGDLEGEEYAEVSGIVRGVALTHRSLAAAGVL